MELGGGVCLPETGPEIAEWLARRRVEMDQDELVFSFVAARFARTDEYEQQGFDSPIQWIKANCHMSGGAAADRVCVGEQLERLDKRPHLQVTTSLETLLGLSGAPSAEMEFTLPISSRAVKR